MGPIRGLRASYAEPDVGPVEEPAISRRFNTTKTNIYKTYRRAGTPKFAHAGILQWLIWMVRASAAGRPMEWNDVWIEHPEPTINEPHKAMSWLTTRPSRDEDRKATCS